MISRAHSQQIKRVVGRGYAQKILDHFREHTITRPSGRFYHRSDVYNALNGQRSNEHLEAAIFDCMGHYLQRREEELQQRDRVMDALTSP